MSTEMQQYSVANQRDAIGAYCRGRGWELVRTYADEGRSGLTLEGREALGQLLNDVVSGKHDFTKLVIYDVSRWGRFQDPDESAHYEFLLRRAGVAVVYCAEPFDNDGSAIAAIFKSVKRAMAGEYSRELSAKVFAGQRRLTELGYWVGGPPGFALQRLLIGSDGVSKGLLRPGERKALQYEHVLVVPGPAEELKVVRYIFRQFVEKGRTGTEIAQRLEAKDAPRPGARRWSYRQVYAILTNAKYAGDLVFNRRSNKLRGELTFNPRSQWIRAEGVIAPIVPKSTFDRAQTIIANRTRWKTDEQFLDALRDLWRRVGTLSAAAVDADDATPSKSAYRVRFGSLSQAYALIGHPVERQYRYVEISSSLRPLRRRLIDRLQADLRSGGARVHRRRSDILEIDGQHTVSVLIARHEPKAQTNNHWRMRYKKPHRPSIGLVARMAPGNEEVLDFFAIPSSEVDLCAVHWLTPESPELERFRGHDPAVLLLEVLGHRERELL